MYGRPRIGPPSVTGATAGWSMAERVGFEPTMSFWAHTPLAGERLQPGSATSPRAGMLPAAPTPRTPADTLRHGGMAERTIATVLKTVEPHGFGGSNPPPSATGLPSPAVGTRPDSVPDAGAQVGQPVVSREGRLGGLLAHGLAVGAGGWIGPQELHLAVLHVEVP